MLFAYPRLAMAGPLTRTAAGLRALGITLIAALGLNVLVGATRSVRPLVALDVSASWGAGGDTSAFAQARIAAADASTDSVLAFGDSIRRLSTDQTAADRSSRIGPLAERAIATGRPLVVFTDGKLADPEALDGLPEGSRVEVIDPVSRQDAAVAEVRAPRVAAAGDTVEARATIVAGASGSAAGEVTLLLDGATVGRVRFDSLAAFAERVLTIRFVAPTGEGDRALVAALGVAGDTDIRNDSSATVLELASGAVAVLVSTAPDLDARELAALLRGTVNVPTRAYFRVSPGQWREDGALGAIAESVVLRAMRNATLVVLHGDTALFGPPRDATAGSLALIAPPTGPTEEWFATGAPLSPMSRLLSGTPWDSLPPLDVSPMDAVAPEFEVLETRRARRLDRRVAMAGWERPRRIVVSGASGFWRWRFRGGAGADAFTSVWGSTLDWLANERPDRRPVVPATSTVHEGDPITWRRGVGTDSVVTARVSRRGAAAATGDSLALRFGSGNAPVQSRALSRGIYEVHTSAQGDRSLLVVNPSTELIPSRPTVRGGAFGSRPVSGESPRARDYSWLFALAIGALCTEWVLRRRAGLR